MSAQLNTITSPHFDSTLSPSQIEGWRSDAVDLVGSAQPTERIDQLAAVLAASPHLNRVATQFADDLPILINGDWQAVLDSAQTSWKQNYETAATDAQLMQNVRHYRNRAQSAIALSELVGTLDIEQSWSLLTTVAETALQGVVNYLLAGQPAKECGWVILGLGKLGAGELNYSSDLDLIALYEDTAEAQSKHYNELTRRLSQLLSQQTEDGFGWRIDFRLRPDPAVTPLCLSTDAAIAYYESIARTWERAAFVRGRPVAGNLKIGQRFLAHISPFIWRRTLDYTVLEDLQAWLRHLPTPTDYFGFDVKLGAFGIRHIELLIHMLQLLGGGRHENLRQHYTFAALNALGDENWLKQEQTEQMKCCYRLWRLVEHRLQYLRDAQTHSLPRNDDEMAGFAAFVGLNSAEELRNFLQNLQQATDKACKHPLMDRLLEAHQSKADQSNRALASAADRAVNSQWLADIGFARPEDMMDIIDGWMSGRIQVTRSERARYYLGRFLSPFLVRLGKADMPDSAFACFADLIGNLPAGAQIFALFVQNPQLVELVTNLLVKAPAMTAQLSRKPAMFDLLLETDFFIPFTDDPLKPPANILPTAKTVGAEQALDQLCVWASESQFRVQVHSLQKLCSLPEASRRLSEIADICIRQVTQMAQLDLQRRYGQLPDARFAVLGLGRLGSQCLTFASDLDLIFVYDSIEQNNSSGQQSMSTGQYYNRLAQLVISWLTVQTAQGKLFDIDTRLRPDGQSGALATNLKKLTSYYQAQAWPWEYCAFLKTRLIHSDQKFTDAVERTLVQIKTSPPESATLASDIVTMRQRLASDAGLSGTLKKRPGGFLDAEFLTVLLALQGGHVEQLIDPCDHPEAILRQMAEAEDRTDKSLVTVCRALAELETITQFTSLCLGKPASRVSDASNEQSWLALAELLGLTKIEDIDSLIDKNCQQIEKILEEFLQKMSPVTN